MFFTCLQNGPGLVDGTMPLLVRTINEPFLPTRATFRTSSASERHYLQPMLVLLTILWCPAPVCVGGLLYVQAIYCVAYKCRIRVGVSL